MCTSGCPTQDHKTFGECLRSKNLRVAYCNSAGGQDYTAQKKFDADLAAYKSARAQGIQPATTNRRDVDAAVAVSNQRGQAFDAS
jgi:hypothetical protein